MSDRLPSNWVWVPLGDYLENHDAARIPVSSNEREKRKGQYPYYGASGVIDQIDGYTHDGEYLLLGEDGANLLTRSKPIAFIAKGKFWVNNHAHVLKCKADAPNSYVAYYINSIDLSPYVTGTAQPKLSQSKMNTIPIPVAPPDQQKLIVAEIEKQFSRLDEAVANLKRVKANIKRYKAAVLKAAVEGRLVETEAELARREGRSYETGEQLLQRILETRRREWKGKGKYKKPTAPDTSDLPALPEGWVWSNFECAAERVTVGHVGSMKDEYVERGVPFLRSQNVRSNRYDAEGLKFISEKFHQELGKSTLKPGDIVVVRSGSVGVSCVIPEQLTEANCSDLVIIKTPRAVLPDFGAYYMNSVVETRVAAGKVGVALIHFNTQAVAELPLPVPPLAEQRRIVADVDLRLSLVREMEAQVEANQKRAERLRQSILANAFSGTLGQFDTRRMGGGHG